MLKQLFLLAAALLALAACEDQLGGPKTVAQAPGGARVVDCAAGGSYQRPGPCYNDANITRYVNDNTRDITPRVNDNTRDVTDRRNRDSTYDRSVYCIDVAAVIVAPSFMVFFDWDKSDLSDKALDTIGRAAEAYRSKGGARVTATGHTDTSGPPQYNMALSLRRANAVKDQLVHDGVKPEDISVVGLGETSPLVPTADGVREAQNRRVEIVLK